MKALTKFINRLLDPNVTIEEDRLTHLVRKFELRNYYIIFTALFIVTTIKFVINPATYYKSYLISCVWYALLSIFLYRKQTRVLNACFAFLHFISAFLFPYLNPTDMIGGPYTMMIYAFAGLCASKSTALFVIQVIANVYGYSFIMDNHILVKLEQMSKEEILQQVTNGYFGYLRISAFLVPVIVVYHNFFFSTMRDTVRLSKDLAETNSELEKKKSELEQEIKTKAAFLITFSHELKNAINGLNGNLSLAMDVNKNKEVDSYLSTAKVCSTMIRHFMQNILDMNKIDADNLHISPSQTDSQEFFKGLWEVSSEMIRNKRLRGAINFLTQIPKNLLLDSDRVSQVVTNLVSNAVKFTESGQITIQVKWIEKNEIPFEELLSSRTERAEDASYNVTEEESPLTKLSTHRQDSHIRKFLKKSFETSAVHEGLFVEYDDDVSGVLEITVSDTGCGMNEHQLQTIFKKFSQIDQQEQNVRRVGCGRGLWISKSIAQGMSGDIVAKSREGAGTKVTFQIGTTSLVNKNSTMRTFRSCYSDSKDSLDAPKKLLIADDDSFNTELLRRFASKLNIECLWVSNGKDLVAKYQECYREVGMIISDNNMPEMEGVEAALKIAEFMTENRIKKIPVFLLTADASILVKKDVKLVGVTKMISKPMDFVKFADLVKAYPLI